VLAGRLDRNAWTRLRSAAPLFTVLVATVLVYLGLRTLAMGSSALSLTSDVPLRDRVLLAIRVIPLSVRLLVWPVGLNPTHSVAPPSGPVDANLLLGALLALLAVAVGLVGRRTPGVGIGLAWLVIAWLPVSNLVPIAGFVVAERYLYLPSAGLCLMLGGAAAWALDRGRPWHITWVAAVGVVVLTLGGLAAAQAELWRDPRAFYEGLVQRNPASALAHNNLGEVYLVSGEGARAEEAFRTALRLHPANAAALSTLGLAAQRRGNSHEAKRLYREALAVQPSHAEAWNNLGTLHEAEGAWVEAAAAYQAAVRAAPGTARYLGNLAGVLAVQGRREEAATLLRRAIVLDPAGTRWQTALQALQQNASTP
jgi:Flp pilus assembly protein TadD